VPSLFGKLHLVVTLSAAPLYLWVGAMIGDSGYRQATESPPGDLTPRFPLAFEFYTRTPIIACKKTLYYEIASPHVSDTSPR